MSETNKPDADEPRTTTEDKPFDVYEELHEARINGDRCFDEAVEFRNERDAALAEVKRLEQQRDGLLAACNRLTEYCEGSDFDDLDFGRGFQAQGFIEEIEAAVAKAEGK